MKMVYNKRNTTMNYCFSCFILISGNDKEFSFRRKSAETFRKNLLKKCRWWGLTAVLHDHAAEKMKVNCWKMKRIQNFYSTIGACPFLSKDLFLLKLLATVSMLESGNYSCRRA